MASPCVAPAFLLLNCRRGRPHARPWRYMRRQPNDTAPARELAEGCYIVDEKRTDQLGEIYSPACAFGAPAKWYRLSGNPVTAYATETKPSSLLQRRQIDLPKAIKRRLGKSCQLRTRQTAPRSCRFLGTQLAGDQQCTLLPPCSSRWPALLD